MRILITGGSGLIGSELTKRMLSIGHKVVHLSRNPRSIKDVPVFKWDPAKGEIEEDAFKGVDTIVHLAGANIAEGRWTKKRRKEIIDSRILSTKLLHDTLERLDHSVSSVICASAIGFYGDRGDQWLTEEHGPQPVFLSEVCQLWEQELSSFNKLGIRTCILRIGIVLSKEGGALPKTTMSLNFGLAPSMGSGKQYYSWIHLTDLCRLIETAIENVHFEGIFNAVAPKPETYLDFMHIIKEVKSKKAIIFPSPRILFTTVLGEMASILLYSARVSAQKITQYGFKFIYKDLRSALKNIYPSSN